MNNKKKCICIYMEVFLHKRIWKSTAFKYNKVNFRILMFFFLRKVVFFSCLWQRTLDFVVFIPWSLIFNLLTSYSISVFSSTLYHVFFLFHPFISQKEKKNQHNREQPEKGNKGQLESKGEAVLLEDRKKGGKGSIQNKTHTLKNIHTKVYTQVGVKSMCL